MSRSMSFIRTASERLSSSALTSDRLRSASLMTSAWCPSSTLWVTTASGIDAVLPGDCADLDTEPARGEALARCYLVGIPVDLAAGPQDQLSVVAVANFIESEIDGRGDAVDRERPDRHPLALLQADLLGVEGDIGVGSHIKILLRPDVGVSPEIAGIEAGGIQNGVHRRRRGLDNAEAGFAQSN